MQRFLKLTSACLILGIVLQGTALAQSAGAQTFGAESYPYATEAQNLQRANDPVSYTHLTLPTIYSV